MSTVSLFGPQDNRTLNVTTDFSRQGPCSISFSCSRAYLRDLDSHKLYLSQKVHDIFKNAVEGRAHEDINPNVSGHCAFPDSVSGHCGNMREALGECRCEDLNRKAKPRIRYHFESTVINKILTHAKIEQSLRSPAPFLFNLAIFCSGRLLGEEVLLFRLLNELCKQRASGTIRLFLIDRAYSSAIELGNSQTALHQNQYLQQFLTEICECLPPSLKIDGTIFAEADDYTAQAQADDRFKHDLLIGADIENTQQIMSDINAKASAAHGQTPLALVRSITEGGPPGSCDIVDGQLANCFLYDIPLDPLRGRLPEQRRRQRAQEPLEVPILSAVAIVALAAVILGVVLSKRPNR